MTGCVTSEVEDSNSNTALTDEAWLVEDIAGRGVIDRAQTTLSFADDGRLSGNTACNNYFASYRVQGSTLQIGDPGSTRRACPPAVIDQESRFLSVLNQVNGYRIDDTGILNLSTSTGTPMLARRTSAPEQSIAAPTSLSCTLRIR